MTQSADRCPGVKTYPITICDQCISLEGAECHNPDCVFCRREMREVSEYLDALLIRPIVDGKQLPAAEPIDGNKLFLDALAGKFGHTTPAPAQPTGCLEVSGTNSATWNGNYEPSMIPADSAPLPAPSRSIQRRVAIQKGEPMPTFAEVQPPSSAAPQVAEAQLVDIRKRQDRINELDELCDGRHEEFGTCEVCAERGKLMSLRERYSGSAIEYLLSALSAKEEELKQAQIDLEQRRELCRTYNQDAMLAESEVSRLKEGLRHMMGMTCSCSSSSDVTWHSPRCFKLLAESLLGKEKK